MRQLATQGKTKYYTRNINAVYYMAQLQMIFT